MIRLKSIDYRKKAPSTLVIPVCEDKEIHTNKTLLSLVQQATSHAEFKGEKGESIVLYHTPGVKTERVIFMGLGALEKVKAESLRSAAGRAVKKGIDFKLKNLCLIVPSAKKINMEPETLLEAMLEGALLANHLFDRYKKEKKKRVIKRIDLATESSEVKKYRGLPTRVATICGGTLLAREWVSTPANDKKPARFANMIAQKAKKAGLGVTVLDEKILKKQKFGALLAVGTGSKNKPRLAVLTHSPRGAKKTVVLVGKGVTFDSGGINLKPTGSIETMKTDMSGAAAVAATMIAVAGLKPKIKIIGIMPIVENMISGGATRPGDVVTSYDGKTVEIGNTDAEGRLILIDAISWAIKKYKPDTVIDMATLTGACVVALGERIAGVFSDDDPLAEAIMAAGEKTHERCWRLPLPEDYRELLNSDIADINNISGGRWGGAITAALFIKEFVGKTRWAHIDIAGPARGKKATDYCGPDGTGFGVRLLCKLLLGM